MAEPAAAIRRLDAADGDFDAALGRLIAFDTAQDEAIDTSVASIVADVRARGDAALLEYTALFDHVKEHSVSALELGAAELDAALAGLPVAQRDALATAASRIRAYHERQRIESWSYTEADGTRLGQNITPLDRVGVYVPGGKAAYPSTVLMNALPAHVAGVGEIIMVVPTPHGVRNALVLAAASLAGVTRVFAVGGAQAIAALAYGTATIPAVDKIVGPGNAYVAAAKRRVFGAVGIDMIAGPSEVVVIADASADPDWVAMDLFSQAEHDEAAQAILLSPDAALLDRVAASIARMLPGARAQGHRRQVARAARRADPGARPRPRRARSPTASRRSIWSLPSPIPTRWWARSATQARSFSGTTARRRSATTAPVPTTCFPLRAARASPRRSVCTISRSAAASSRCRAPARAPSAPSHRRWRAAKDCRRTRKAPNTACKP